MKKKLIELYGWYGIAAIVTAYGLSSFGAINSSGLPYQILNLTGSIGIIIVALTKKDYQSSTLNIIWTIISIAAIIKILIQML